MKEVFERDKYRCVKCGTHLELTIDHKIPRALGGTDDLDNLQTMCFTHNTSKGTRVEPQP
jgi:5-methylcytosine-specific restriction endonuclease McrA